MDNSRPDLSIVVVRERPDLQRATSLAKPVVCLSYLRRFPPPASRGPEWTSVLVRFAGLLLSSLSIRLR